MLWLVFLQECRFSSLLVYFHFGYVLIIQFFIFGSLFLIFQQLATIYIEPLRKVLHGVYFIAPSIALKYIGFLNFLQFSYIIKFLWAPIVDCFCPLGIERRLGWMLLTQSCLFVVMIAYGQIDPSQ